MKEYYKYYIAVHFEDRLHLGNMPAVGWWRNYTIYEVEDHVISRLDLIKVRVVSMPKKIAYGWAFCEAQRDFIRVDANNTPLIEQIGGLKNLEPHKQGKYTYYLTDEDKANGIAFAKIILKEYLYRNYKNMWAYTKENYSDIYSEYFLYVYGTNDKTLISNVEKTFPKLTLEYKKYYKQLGVLVEDMSKLEDMIDNIESISDVHQTVHDVIVRIDSFPEIIRRDEKIKNVQRTTES